MAKGLPKSIIKKYGITKKGWQVFRSKHPYKKVYKGGTSEAKTVKKTMGKKRFTPEYKEEIIKLVTERKKKISEVAKDIGVTPTSIRRWITQYSEYGKDAFPGKGNLRAEDDKIRKLMRDNIDLKEENEILKKAMAIFSRDVK